MRTQTIALLSPAPGTLTSLAVQRFGTAGARPLAYIQAALHADEIPGMLAAQHLRTRLAELEAAGRIAGEVVLVPVANPLGLAQRVLGTPIGRFDLADGQNFNRGFPHVTPAVAERVAARLGNDAAQNIRVIRDALQDAVADGAAVTPAEHLKRALLGLAIGADLVLDLHCDAEAVLHLYTLTPSAEAFGPLAALLGAQAVLLATESGDDPFDEACSRPWHDLAARFPDQPIPLACHAATVELRGGGDVGDDLAAADAAAILAFLTLRGVLAGPAPALPATLCAPTSLAGVEPILAPAAGIVVFRRRPGERVEAGDSVVDIVDPLTGASTPARAAAAGLVFARASSRFAAAGQRLAKVAGTTLQRSGKLLSP